MMSEIWNSTHRHGQRQPVSAPAVENWNKLPADIMSVDQMLNFHRVLTH